MALVEFLKKNDLPKPKVFSSGQGKMGVGQGAVSWEGVPGAVLLEDKHGHSYRLAWDSANTPRQIPIPAGDYEVVGYRVYRKGEKGVPWILSASGPGIAKLKVLEGKVARLMLPAGVQISKRISNGQVQMSVQAGDDAGATLYKDGLRIPMSFAIFDPGGKRVSEGKINYG